jgi:hypothetical protein
MPSNHPLGSYPLNTDVKKSPAVSAGQLASGMRSKSLCLTPGSLLLNDATRCIHKDSQVVRISDALLVHLDDYRSNADSLLRRQRDVIVVTERIQDHLTFCQVF